MCRLSEILNESINRIEVPLEDNVTYEKRISTKLAFMDAIFAFIEQQSTAQQEILYSLHDYFMSFPNIEVKKRFHIPFYYQKTWICYTNPQKKGGIELVFINGKELSDYPGLEANGRKMVKGITYQSAADINYDILDPLWMEALALDIAKKS